MFNFKLYIELNVENNEQRTTAYDVRLYDNQGNMLRQQKTGGGTVEFDVSNLPNGPYFVHVYDGVNDNPEMKMVVVEH